MAKIKPTKANIDNLKAGVQESVSARLRNYTIGPFGIVTPAIAQAMAQQILAARQPDQSPRFHVPNQLGLLQFDLAQCIRCELFSICVDHSNGECHECGCKRHGPNA
jgi:hypothetical protein